MSLDQLNLNDSKTKFICSSSKSDKHLQDSETGVADLSKIKKLNQCKLLGVTSDKHKEFKTETKKVLTKMAVGIKTIEVIQHKFPTKFSLMLFRASVMSHFENSALFLLQNTSILLLSLKKQMKWALKSVYFRSNIKGLFDLRIHKSVLGIRQRVELKSLTYSIQYIKTRKKSIFRQNKVTHRKLPIAKPFESNNSFGEGTICFMILQIFLSPHFPEVELIALKYAR